MLTGAQRGNAVCLPDKKAPFTDSEGLYFEVSLEGLKRWFLKFCQD